MPHVSGKELYPHQREALDRLGNGKVLWGGVGTGKSLTAVAYYVEKEAPRDIVVITTAKKRDSLEWEGEFVKYGIGREYSTQGVLTVDSWNNIGKYQNLHGAFFIFDEQRLVGSGKWVKAFIRISRRNRWILLSATPGDTWLDYVPLFVANGFFENQTEFKREHVVYKPYSKFPKVDRYVGVGKLLRLRHSLLVEMPYLHSTIRHVTDVDVEYDLEKYKQVTKRKWNVFENRPLRNVTELFIAMRRVVNGDPSRLVAVKELMRKHPRLIIFYNFDYELEVLREGLSEECSSHAYTSSCTKTKAKDSAAENVGKTSRTLRTSNSSSMTPSLIGGTTAVTEKENECSTHVCTAPSTGTSKREVKSASSASSVRKTSPVKSTTRTTTTTSTTTSCTSLVVAEWNGHKHNPVPTGDRWVYLVQYTAGAEGWNCVSTNAMCFYSLPYSYKTWHQAHGRIDRLNTKYIDLYYYVLFSKSDIDRAIRKALEDKKSFNEKVYYKD